MADGVQQHEPATSALAGLRWQALRALRDIASGSALIVQTDPDTRERRPVIFEGQPLPQLIGSVLLRHGWVQPKRSHWMANSSFYELSPCGAAVLEAGLRWWDGQPWLQRLLLRAIE